MRLIRDVTSVKQPMAATIGNFDGVHFGHQAILANLCSTAKQLNLPSMLIIFEPTPQEYFLQDNAPARLSSLREKLRLLQQTDIDYVMVLNFTAALANMSAEKFVTEILQQQLQVQYLLIGDDFHFGKNRLGDFALLQAMQNEQFQVMNMPTKRSKDERISSTRIRNVIGSGDLEQAIPLLGRTYSMLGKVIHGDKRGRTIGFPTANVLLKRHRSPVLGVYAVKVYGIDNKILHGVANVGNRPTVGGTRSLLEIHLFNFSDDIYGQNIQIEFCHKLRDEKRFDSFDELKNQIWHDADQAKQFFGVQYED